MACFLLRNALDGVLLRVPRSLFAQLLRDNLTLWTSDDAPEPEETNADIGGPDDARVQDL